MAELIIIIAVLVFCGKYILFNVKINSVIFMILGIVALSLKPPLIPVSTLSVILLVINIIDCIRDIAVSNDFYRSMEYGLDTQFVIKSLSTVALILLGWFVWDKNLIYAFLPRALFLCVINPIIAIKVMFDINGKMEIGYPLPYNKWQYSNSRYECYYYQKIIKSLFDKGELVANIDTVTEERDLSNQKYSKSYPKTILSKITNFFNKETKAKMEEIEEELNNTSKHKAYISSIYFEQYANIIVKALKAKKTTLSPWKIKELIELKDLNLTAPNGYTGDVKWSEYFIIKSLKQLVRNGVINDIGNNIDEPLSNHAYGVQLKSNNCDNDPRFSLDD